VGFGAVKIGWLPADSSRPLAKIVINIACPCLIFTAMCSGDFRSSELKLLLLLFGFGILLYVYQILFGAGLTKLLRVERADRGVYRNFLLFTNNGFMGFPVALAVFGERGLFYMVILNITTNLFLFTIGAWNVQTEKTQVPLGRKIMSILLQAPILIVLISAPIMIAQIKIPTPFMDLMTTIGNMTVPLSMMVIGIQLTESKPRELFANGRLIAMCAMRLLLIPGVLFLLLIPLWQTGFFSPMIIGIMVLTLALPCGSVPVALAEEYGANAKLSAEGTFLSTLLAMGTIPVAGILLSML
jgi:predicted permease